MNFSGYIMSGDGDVARVNDNYIESIIKENIPLYQLLFACSLTGGSNKNCCILFA